MTMTDADPTFQEWLQENKQHLEDWPLNLLCILAVSRGFKVSDVVRDVEPWLANSRRLLRLVQSGYMNTKWNRAMLAQQGAVFGPDGVIP